MMHQPESRGAGQANSRIDIDAPVERNANLAIDEADKFVAATIEMRRRLEMHREAVVQLLNRLSLAIDRLPDYEATAPKQTNGAGVGNAAWTLR